MSAIGPNSSQASILLTQNTSPMTIGSADTLASAVFNAGVIHRIFCNAAGTLSIKRKNDTAFSAYTVAASQYIDGEIIAIAGTSNGVPSTAISIVCEL